MVKQGCFNENAITSKKRNESDVIRNLIKRNVEYSDQDYTLNRPKSIKTEKTKHLRSTIKFKENAAEIWRL